MSSGIALFGLSYIAAIVIFIIIGEIGIAILAAFILFAGLRICGH